MSISKEMLFQKANGNSEITSKTTEISESKKSYFPHSSKDAANISGAVTITRIKRRPEAAREL